MLSPEEDRTLALLYLNPAPVLFTATVITFGGLRGTRYLWRHLRKKTPASSMSDGKPKRDWSILLDISIGVLVGGGGLFAGALRMDMNEHKGGGGLAPIPLLPGRSSISDHLCGPLQQEYQRQWRLATGGNPKPPFQTLGDYVYGWKHVDVTHWDRQDILESPFNQKLGAYLEFVRNCQKRTAMEQRIRKAKGLKENDPVEIPPPGVDVEDSRRDWKPVFSKKV